MTYLFFLNKQNLFLTIMKTRKSKSKVPVASVPGEGSPPSLQTTSCSILKKLDDLSIDDGVLKSLTTTVLEFIYVFRSFRVCLMKLGALMLGAYMLIIIISFWCISPFISKACPFFSHLINVS
jgi:hypothetical protein